MRDQIIRQAFHSSILKSAHNESDTFVVDELGMKNGAFRADIAVLNGKLIGYEIKTERDNLKRLPSQAAAYNEIFDKVFIIVSKNHLKKAITHIPDWWGVYEIASAGKNEYKFQCYRKAKINKFQNAYSMAQLLWKEEAIEVANTLLNQNIKEKSSRHEVYNLISNTCSSKDLSKIVLKYLKQRENWRADRLPLL